MNQSKSHGYPLRRAAIVAALLALVLPVTGEAGDPPAIETNGYFQGRPAAAFDFGGSPSVPGATHARYLVAFEADTFPVAKQVWGKLIQWDGERIEIPSGDSVYDWALNISADGAVAHTKPTVAFKFGSITAPRRSYFVAWQRSDGALGFRILDRAGNPTMAPRKIALSGLTLRDPSAATKPDVGFSCGLTVACPYPHLLAYRATSFGTTTDPFSSIRLAMVNDASGAWSEKLVESLGAGDQPLSAPQIAYGHSASNSDGYNDDYYVLAYRRPNGQIVVRKVSVVGGTPDKDEDKIVVTSSSNGPPVLAYSYASDRWAVFWRTIISNPYGTSAALRGQLFAGSPGLEPLVPVGSLVTAVSVPLSEFATPASALPEYSLAGSHTATEYWPYEGVFELAYVRGSGNGEVYTRKIFASGTLGSTTRLTDDAKNDRYVQLAVTRIDPLTTSFASPLACTGAPGSRCALWVYEHFWSSTDHDIHGYWTSSQY
ncbi:MAG TPA: hypothetical protein VGG03_08950 [Thermoanaerobaculia bacterium]|jgi:hypothetical protein